MDHIGIGVSILAMFASSIANLHAKQLGRLPCSASIGSKVQIRRVRDANRPGLVVTLLNVHRPRDRSHYERFAAWHESFYRNVEALSVSRSAQRDASAVCDHVRAARSTSWTG